MPADVPLTICRATTMCAAPAPASNRCVPLSIGFAGTERRFVRLIGRNTPVPAQRSFVVRAEDSESAQEYTPFEGFEMTATVEHVFLRGRQIVRDWVVKFNAEGPDGLIDRKIPGRPSKLDEAHRDALRR